MTVDSVHDEIIRSLDVSTATAALDIGCGKGADLVRIGGLAPENARLVGLDSSRNGIDAARAAAGSDPRFSFLVHDVSAGLPFADEEFDRVLSVNLLECIQDKQHLLREVHRVLAPRGRIAFAHWDWDSQLIDGDDKKPDQKGRPHIRGLEASVDGGRRSVDGTTALAHVPGLGSLRGRRPTARRDEHSLRTWRV